MSSNFQDSHRRRCDAFWFCGRESCIRKCFEYVSADVIDFCKDECWHTVDMCVSGTVPLANPRLALAPLMLVHLRYISLHRIIHWIFHLKQSNLMCYSYQYWSLNHLGTLWTDWKIGITRSCGTIDALRDTCSIKVSRVIGIEWLERGIEDGSNWQSELITLPLLFDVVQRNLTGDVIVALGKFVIRRSLWKTLSWTECDEYSSGEFNNTEKIFCVLDAWDSYEVMEIEHRLEFLKSFMWIRSKWTPESCY